jgi:molybdenum cofactor biosynthesis protein B
MPTDAAPSTSTAAAAGAAATSHRSRVEHEAARAVRCAVVTISDTRTPATDESGRLAQERIAATGHSVAAYRVVRDEPAEIRAALAALPAAGATVAILNGGTGIARRDSTFEAVDALLDKRLPGFGELFRALSFPEVGPAALLSRATAGVIGDLLVFALPGSPHAVALALDRLILPDLAHLAWETTRR